MDMLREGAPFLVGMLVPPLVMLVIRASWTGHMKFIASLVPALVLGACASFLAGELAADLPDAVMAIIIDTSLVYAGSQVAYRFFWKAALEAHLVRGESLAAETVRK